MNKGILIIATGHSYYLDMAVNLAASIKVNGDIPICLVHDDRAYDNLSGVKKNLFDSVLLSQLPGFYLKTQLDLISPFDRTLYLDADTLILPNSNLKRFIGGLSGFNIINERKDKDHLIWADPAEIRRLTGNATDPFYHCFSEMVYFENGGANTSFFEKVRKYYADPGVIYRSIADQVPDELAYISAMMEMKIKPDIDNWCPVFWHFRNRRDSNLPAHMLAKKYVAYSLGGNVLPDYVKNTYNNLLSFYASKIGIKNLTPAKDKRVLLRNRLKI